MKRIPLPAKGKRSIEKRDVNDDELEKYASPPVLNIPVSKLSIAQGHKPAVRKRDVKRIDLKHRGKGHETEMK